MRYLVTSDSSLTADQIITIYHKRWKVEEYHRSLKQNASGQTSALSRSAYDPLKERPINLLCSSCPCCQVTIFLPFDEPITNAVRAAVGMKPRAGRAHSGRVTDC